MDGYKKMEEEKKKLITKWETIFTDKAILELSELFSDMNIYETLTGLVEETYQLGKSHQQVLDKIDERWNDFEERTGS